MKNTSKKDKLIEKGILWELSKLFLKLGTIAFGGPAAHIAMMEDEVVKKREWMSREHFLDLVGVTNLIPGPNSSEMAMHCGHEKAGWKGLVVAGVSFITPAVIITAIFAWLYQKYGELPNVAPFIYGIKPAVIAIIASAIITLGKKALKNYQLGIMGAITVIASLSGLNEIVALFGCGALGVIIYIIKNSSLKKPKDPFNNSSSPSNSSQSKLKSIAPIIFSPLLSANIAIIGNTQIFLTFLKIGALLYGSGYVLFAFLDAELVAKGLLTRQILIDSVAVGQFTPGPVLSTATFIGWQLNGFWGSIVATLGIFTPSFLLVLLVNPIIPKLRKSKIMAAFLDAVNIASVAVILVVCIHMFSEAVTDWRSLIIGIVSMGIILIFKKINSAFIVIGGSILGAVLLLL